MIQLLMGQKALAGREGSQLRRVGFLFLGICLLLAGSALADRASAESLARAFPSRGVSRPDVGPQPTRQYWTEPRVAKALGNDLSSPKIRMLEAPQTSSRALRNRASAAVPPYFGPAVGRLLFRYRGGAASCSGSLIDTPSQRVVLTAGHCLFERGVWSNTILFIPELQGTSQPHGSFTAATKTVEINWFNSTRRRWQGGNGRFDFGAVVLQERLAQRIQPLAYRIYPSGSGTARLVGYPGSPGDWPRMCTSGTWLSNSFERGRRGPRVRASRCDLKGGSSGGPWLSWIYNFWTGETDLTVTGLNSTLYWTLDRRNYWVTSPYFGFYAKEFIDYADVMAP